MNDGQTNTTMHSLGRIAEGLGVQPWELLVPRESVVSKPSVSASEEADATELKKGPAEGT